MERNLFGLLFGDGRDEKVIRFCFAKREDTLAAAFERLQRFC